MMMMMLMLLAPSDRNSHSLWSSSTQRLLRPCLGALRWCDGGRVVAEPVHLCLKRLVVGQESMLEIWCLTDRLSAILEIIAMTKDYFPSDWTYGIIKHIIIIVLQMTSRKMPGICLFWTWFSPMSPIHHHHEIFTHVMHLVARSVRFEDHNDDALDRMGLPWATNLKSVKT